MPTSEAISENLELRLEGLTHSKKTSEKSPSKVSLFPSLLKRIISGPASLWMLRRMRRGRRGRRHLPQIFDTD